MCVCIYMCMYLHVHTHTYTPAWIRGGDSTYPLARPTPLCPHKSPQSARFHEIM